MFSDFIYLKLGSALSKFYPIVGSSGCICSVIGLYASKLYVDARIDNENIKYSVKTIIGLSIFLILTILLGTDIFMHFGGLLFGFLFGIIVFVGFGNAEMRPLLIKSIVGLSIYTILIIILIIY